jgi:hypothetical protein
MLFLGILICMQAGAQNKTNGSQSKKQTTPGTCWMMNDSTPVMHAKIQDVIKWVEHSPFLVNCENHQKYLLKSYEFTLLSLKPFLNQSYGIGDENMIPILGRKALDKLTPGTTLILKDVEMVCIENNKVEKGITISVKIED